MLAGVSGGCASLLPTVQNVSGRVVHMDFRGVEMAFDVTIKNNAFLAIPVPRGRYAVRVADHDVVSSDNVPGVSLPAGGTGVFTLPAKINYLDLWAIERAFREADEVPYELGGAIIFDVAGRSIPLDLKHEGTIPILRIPTITIENVDTSGFSLGGTNVTVAAKLTNPNVFALGIQKLGYQLTLGGTEIGGVEIDAKELVGPGKSCLVTARCHLSAKAAAGALIKAGKLKAPSLKPIGEVTTPYGSATLPGS